MVTDAGRPLRIAHLTATFPPYRGGAGNVAFHNARCLAEMGHDVTVITASTDQPALPERLAFRVRRLPAPFRIGNAPLLPHLLRMPRYDIVHLHFPFIFGAELLWIRSLLARQPYVVTYHNDLLSPGLKGSLFRLYDRIWPPRLLHRAGRIAVPSIDFARASPTLGPIVRDHPERVVEIPNGVDVGRFNPAVDGSDVRARFAPEPDGRLLVFVGSMDGAHHAKGGVPILLEAVARLDENVTVLLVGTGDRVEDYLALARALGIGERVRLAGGVPDDELARIYAAADLVVQPSPLFETFGMVAAEAMASGTPVVVSDLPGGRRVVSEAGGGLLAQPGDPVDLAAKVRTLLGDATLRAELAEAGRSAVVARYDWRLIGPRLVDLYRSVA